MYFIRRSSNLMTNYNLKDFAHELQMEVEYFLQKIGPILDSIWSTRVTMMLRWRPRIQTPEPTQKKSFPTMVTPEGCWSSFNNVNDHWATVSSIKEMNALTNHVNRVLYSAVETEVPYAVIGWFHWVEGFSNWCTPSALKRLVSITCDLVNVHSQYFCLFYPFLFFITNLWLFYKGQTQRSKTSKVIRKKSLSMNRILVL